MITSKPKGNTLFALSMFLILCYGLLGYTLYNFLNFKPHYWYQYAIFIIITPIALSVTVKTIQSFKIIRIKKEQLFLHHPILLKKKKFNMKQMEYWEETIIKTQGTTFKQLTLNFGKTKVKLANQENTEYIKVLRYLQRKYATKRRAEAS